MVLYFISWHCPFLHHHQVLTYSTVWTPHSTLHTPHSTLWSPHPNSNWQPIIHDNTSTFQVSVKYIDGSLSGQVLLQKLYYPRGGGGGVLSVSPLWNHTMDKKGLFWSLKSSQKVWLGTSELKKTWQMVIIGIVDWRNLSLQQL